MRENLYGGFFEEIHVAANAEPLGPESGFYRFKVKDWVDD